MKHGFTLIELLVYMALLGFIIVVAGRVFSDSTIMRVRSQNMVKVAEEVGKASNFIAEDISQMGIKAWMEKPASSNEHVVQSNNFVYIGGPTPATFDNSSFRLYKGKVNVAKGSCDGIISEDTKFDSLIFRRPAISDNGSFTGTMEIKWHANNKCELYRTCKIIDGNSSECPADSVLIAKNIRNFSFHASAPGARPSASATALTSTPSDTVFPVSTISFDLISAPETGKVRAIYSEPNAGNTRVSFSRFSARNGLDLASNDKYHHRVYLTPANGNIANCISVPIKKGESWVVEFDMPFPYGSGDDAWRDSSSSQILPGKDHIAVGLRSKSDAVITGISPDVIFYASLDQSGDLHSRYAEFFAKETPVGDACVALTFSFYNPMAGDGKLIFSNFKVYKKATGTFHFVKANSNYESNFAAKYATEDDDATNKLRHKRNVKAFELLLEINYNGEVAGTYSKEQAGMTILVPNNGVVQQ